MSKLDWLEKEAIVERAISNMVDQFKTVLLAVGKPVRLYLVVVIAPPMLPVVPFFVTRLIK